MVVLRKKKLQIKINNTLVEETQSTKYLGTFIDNKLTWKVQIAHIKTKMAKGIGIVLIEAICTSISILGPKKSCGTSFPSSNKVGMSS